MTVLNAAATLQIAGNFGTDYATSTIDVLAGTNVLATHSTTSWAATNTGNNGTATAVIANSGAATITGAGIQTATSATITDGTEIITLTVGLSGSGANLILNTLTYINGETSTISSLVVTVPAS